MNAVPEGEATMYWGGGMGAWGYVLMGLSFLVFWAAIITALALLFRSVRATDRRVPAGDRTAENLLAERFARGEIDESEYGARLAVLRRHLSAGP